MHFQEKKKTYYSQISFNFHFELIILRIKDFESLILARIILKILFNLFIPMLLPISVLNVLIFCDGAYVRKYITKKVV